MTNFSSVKSINVNSVFDKKTVKENLNKPLFTVRGAALSTIHNMGKYGENVGFKGDFVAVNLLTGEVFEANAAFLPRGLTDEITQQLDKAEAGCEVYFEATIKAIPSEKSPAGYAWIADAPETEARQNRRRQLLEAALKDSQSLLAAPVAEKKKA